VDTKPKHLSDEASAVWDSVVAQKKLSPGALVTLRIACEAFDRLQDARRVVAEDGVTIDTPTGYKREHPALKIEKEARSGFLQAWRLLKVGEAPQDVGRPPEKRKFGWLAEDDAG